MTVTLTNDNTLLKVIARVSDSSNTLAMPQLPEILKAMAEHSEWQYIKNDVELNQLIKEAEEVRVNYTAVINLRWAYEKVLLRYVQLLLDDRGLMLTYRWDDKNTLLFSMTIEQGREGLVEVYAIRTVKDQQDVVNHEYHEDITRNVFDALSIRIRHVDVGPTHYGYPKVEFITHPTE